MRRGLRVLVLLFAFSATACGQQGLKGEVKAKDEAKADDPNTWDFGKVGHGKDARHVFALKNTTQKELKIKDVNTSCGCTVPQLKKRELRPGESTPLEVKFKSKGYSGAVTQYIYVNTDSVELPVIRFTIKADVVVESSK